MIADHGARRPGSRRPCRVHADRERRCAGAAVAAELVPDRLVSFAARELVPEPAKRPAFPWRPIGSRLSEPVAGVVVANRGHRALRDRQLQVEPPAVATIWRSGWPPGSTAGVASGFVATGYALHVPKAVRSRVRSRTAERRAARESARRAARAADGARACARSPCGYALWKRAAAPHGGLGAEAMGGTIADPAESFQFAALRSARCPSGVPTIRVPRWIQLVGLPVLLLIAWALAGTLGHAIFLFLTASVIAFLLNPLVRSLQGLRMPPRLCGRRGVPLVRGCDGRAHRRARHRRRRADALGGRPGRRLPYGRARTQRRQRFRPRRRGTARHGCTIAGIDVQLREQADGVDRRRQTSPT